MPNATALAMLEGPPLVWCGQTALKFYGRTVVDDEYNGLALDEAEGDRIAASMGEADIVFLRSHGVLVVGRSIAEAWDDLYYLERACEAQRMAEATGRRLVPVPTEVAERTARQMRHEATATARGCTWRASSASSIASRLTGGSEASEAKARGFAPGPHQRQSLRNPFPGSGAAGPSGVGAGGRPLAFALLLLLAAALAGCKLVDQNTFWPPPKPPPPPPPARPGPPAPPPLVVIRFDHPGIAYAGALRQAVAAARARKPDVRFGVVAVAPAAPTLAQQAAGLARASAEARQVAEAIAAQGVPAARIALSASAEPGVRSDEVRVFVH